MNPAKRNPIFYHIVITHAVTFIVGKRIECEKQGCKDYARVSRINVFVLAGIVGNLIVVFVMIGDGKSRNATNLFLVR